MRLKFVPFAVLALSVLSFAQTKPTLPEVQPTVQVQPVLVPQISDTNRMRYLIVYQKAILAKQAFIAALTEASNVEGQIKKEEKLPDAASLIADVSTSTVSVQLPIAVPAPVPPIPAKPIGPAVPTSPQK